MVRFFRISEKGSIKKPTLFALGFFAALAMVTVLVLREHPIIVVFVLWPIEYFFSALVFSRPFREVLSRFLHWTRYPQITTNYTKLDAEWLEANRKLFDKMNIKTKIQKINKGG